MHQLRGECRITTEIPWQLIFGNWQCIYGIKAAIQSPPSTNNIKTKIVFDPGAGITKEVSRLGDLHTCHTFVLPFNRLVPSNCQLSSSRVLIAGTPKFRGRIHFIKASQSQKSVQTANRIFRQYQVDASNDESFFRRYSMKTVSGDFF